MHSFKADIDIIGINPFVHVPEKILKDVFEKAGTNKRPVPIRGTINGKIYRQTLVKFSGNWRLYINTNMLKNSPKRIGETIEVTLELDPVNRKIKPHPKLVKALTEEFTAKRIFDNLPVSRQNEIVRYISFLKTEDSVYKNVKRAIDFLLGNGRFIGRDKP